LKYRLLGEGSFRGTNSINQTSNTVFDIKNNKIIINNIFDWLNLLRKNDADTLFATEVMENIKLGTFDEKGWKMQHFENQIANLEESLREE
jgi:hypothetical protein